MFLHPLGLLALLGVPAVLALHLFRRRFQPRPVSALFLWREDSPHPIAGRKRERLHRTPSFWLEMAAALLLGLACAGPTGCGPRPAQHLVCVLDASASMGALAAPNGTTEAPPAPFFEAAVEIVTKRIGELSPRSLVTLIRSGTHPSLLAGPAAFRREAVLALEDFAPGAGGYPLAPAVALALQLSGGGSVLVVTDHFEPDRFPAEVELVAVGGPRDNLAVTHASRTRDERGAERVLVTLNSFAVEGRSATGTLRTELALQADGIEIRRHAVELERGARKHFAFDLPSGIESLTLTLDRDALAIDNQVFLARPPARTLGLASTLSPTEAVRLGLASGEAGSPVDRWQALIPASAEARAAAADLLIGNPAAVQAAGPHTWVLALEDAAGTESEPVDLIGPFLFEHAHPLLKGVTLTGIIWSSAAQLALAGAPLISAGNQPLLTEVREPGEAGRRIFHMNFNPRRSSLQRSPDWPILLTNLAEMRRRALPGALRTNLSIGEPFRFRGTQPALYDVRCLEDDTVRRVRARELLVVEDWTRPGFYRLESGGRELATFGVSFRDGSESDLSGLASGKRAPTQGLALTRAAMGPLETVLLALAMAALLGDWWVLQRARRALWKRGVEGID